MQCTICNSTKSLQEFVVTRQDRYATFSQETLQNPARYWECAGCRAMNIISSAAFEKAYSEGYYYGMEGDALEFLLKRFNQVNNLPLEKSDNCARVKRIRDFLNQAKFENSDQKYVLDIGSGTGVFVDRFLKEEKSWKAVAIEPEPNACAHLKKVLTGVAVMQGFSNELKHQHKYDLITFNRVLEHIADPIPILAAEKNNLKKDGIIYIEVPDTSSFFQDGANNEAFGYGHYIVYSPESLNLLATKAGFNLQKFERVIEPSGKFTLYGFLKAKIE